MGLCAGIGRVVLVVVNILVLLLGLALTIVGFILRFGDAVYKPFLEFGMFQLQKVLDDTNLGALKVEDMQIGESLQSIAIGLIIGGLVLFGIAFLGCCGACCKFNCLLYLYVIVTVVIMLAEAVAIGLLYGKPDIVKDQAKTTSKQFKGLTSSEVSSLTWNIVMIQFECCGVDSYEDFDPTGSWVNPTARVTLETPIACCKTLPSSDSDFSCAETYNASTSNGRTGCYDTLWSKSFGNKAIAIPVLVIGAIIQIVFIALAVAIIKDDKNKVNPI